MEGILVAKKKTTKKKTPKKKAPSSSSKKTSKKKAATRKKPPSTKKKSKKTGSRKKTATGKKTSSKTTKKSRSKKSTAKKSTAKKSPKKTSRTKQAAVKAKDPKPTKSAEPGKTSKKRKTARVKIARGKSVVEVATSFTADSQGYVVINGRRVRMISTKGMVRTKKKAVAEVEKPKTDEKAAIKKIKTKLSRKELGYYKKLLMIKRAELVGDLNAMELEALRSNDGDVSTMPIHMADIGSDTYEQDFLLGMAENERQRLREIDDALQRIVDRTYGVCQMTGKTIPKSRLEAKPWAKYTIEAARQLEGSWGA